MPALLKVLHRLHRQRALKALERRPSVAHLLVICRGNLCRSPFAAALLRRALEPHRIQVESAGLSPPGRPAPLRAVEAAARHGVDLSVHRSQLVSAARVRAADLIIVMDPTQRRVICERFGRPPRDVLVLGDIDPEAGQRRTIRDPVNQPAAVFDQAYSRIARCAGELARLIAAA